MAEVEIPSYFLCPISYQIMRDPVTLSTGITYDRSSIEHWIFNCKHAVCPVTNQPLADPDLITPNHTLRRLIQAWCVTNAIERVPTPRPPVSQAHIASILDEAAKSKCPDSLLACLQKINSIVLESDRNRSCVESSGAAVDFLASLICNHDDNDDAVINEALSILISLRMSEVGLIDIVSRNSGFFDSLSKMLQRHTAMTLFKSMINTAIAPARLMAMKEEVFIQTVKVLDDRVSTRSTKVALETLIGLCPWGRNRMKAVASGAVHVLIELLIDSEQERRITEMALVGLDKLSGCPEGRQEIVGHAAGIAAVSKKILRVSTAGNERAVKVLYSILRYSATKGVLEEMEQVGVVSKLCLMQVADCGAKAKEKAREILRMHSRVWRRSHCLSPQLQALYPF